MKNEELFFNIMPKQRTKDHTMVVQRWEEIPNEPEPDETYHFHAASEDLYRGTYYGYDGFSPIPFYEVPYLPYKELRDFISTNLAMPSLIIESFKKKLEAHKVTGWKAYPAKLIGRDGKEITTPKYYGFAITGYCGPRKVDKGKLGAGIELDTATWDGSDIFFEDDHWDAFISKRVYKLFMEQDELEVTPASKA